MAARPPRLTIDTAQATAWPEVDEELLKVLPAVLRAVVRALGYARAREWLGVHGGVNVHLPIRRSRTLGLSADELARMGETLAPHLDAARRFWCPKPDRLFRLTRDAAIKTESAYTSIASQARQYGLSSRQITNIRGRETDDRQIDLF